MPSLIYHKEKLIDFVVDAIQESGWEVLYLNNEDPYKLRAYNPTKAYNLKIIVYNITHGGKKRKSDEYRVQIKETSITDEQGFETLILGYYHDLEVFVGFDLEKHRQAAYSASMQIKKENLEKAYFNGFSIYNNKRGEIVVAFKPNFFMEYVQNRKRLHEFGEYSSDMSKLNNLVEKSVEVNSEVLSTISNSRKKVVVNVTKRLRDNSFKVRVLNAYGYRCAMCGIQLKLVDAAHILPVGVDESNDQTYNGVSLCALHHRAYDRSLIMFDEGYDINCNENKLKDLKKIGHDGGANKFLEILRHKIILPPTKTDRPHVEFIRKANTYRGWV